MNSSHARYLAELDHDEDVMALVGGIRTDNWPTGWWGDIGELEPHMLTALEVMLTGCLTPPG